MIKWYASNPALNNDAARRQYRCNPILKRLADRKTYAFNPDAKKRAASIRYMRHRSAILQGCRKQYYASVLC